jgi:PAS domain S-box-containing protein
MTRRRILIVEDEGIIARDLQRQLTDMGYDTVGIATDAGEAIAAAELHHPDLALMDIHLDGAEDGIDTAIALRSRLGIPSIFVTAYATAEVVSKAKTAAPVGYLIKPFDELRLRTTIEIGLHSADVDRRLRLLESALHATANAIVITDTAGAIEWVNPAFAAVTGYSLAEAVGHNPRDLVKSGHHDHAFYAAMWDTLTSGLVWEGELTNRRKDGSLYVEEQTITPVRDGAGRISHYIGVKRDLTEQKRLQQQLQQAQKMEVVGRLAGGVAHDFNNLLTIINGTTELLLLDQPDTSPMKEELQHVLEAGERAARLTRQLLAFSRTQVITPSHVDLADQVNGSAKMLSRLIGEDIHLHIDVARAVGTTLIDRSQAEQVLLNLAVNARDAMPDGGTLTIRVGTTVIERTMESTHGVLSPGAYVTLEVMDTGCGMPPDVLDRLFEPFFTTKTPGRGTGLGLATVAGIVDHCHGAIQVESTLGHGSRFVVLLPTSTGTPQVATDPAALDHRGTETILVVEDEAALRAIVERILTRAGYQVITAASGPDALAVAQTQGGRIDLLLSDVVMPDMSGLDLAEALARDHPQMRIVLMSGYTNDPRLQSVGSPEVCHFLPKPFTATDLLQRVRTALIEEPCAR